MQAAEDALEEGDRNLTSNSVGVACREQLSSRDLQAGGLKGLSAK